MILQKSFQTFFLRFFTFFEKYKFISDVIKIRNNVFWKKTPQSIRKKCKKCDFFDFFGVFQFSKKWKKRENGPKKTSISAFFRVFSSFKAYMMWRFSKWKTLVFFVPFLDRFASAGRCSHVILTFCFFVSKQITFPLVFFDPHFFC